MSLVCGQIEGEITQQNDMKKTCAAEQTNIAVLKMLKAN
jgi:hypothetical protein